MTFSSSVNIYCISSNENIFVVLVLFSYNNLASTLSVCPSTLLSLSLPDSDL